MILCLSCVVVFCTVYALILPAITLERKTVCGQEEHSHTEECYSSDGQLTCGKTEHTHTESCYADDKTLEDQSGEDSQQTPEQNQTADAWKFGYRTVGIAEAQDNKKVAIYVHKVGE